MSQGVRLANSWTKTVNLSTDTLMEIVTDVDAHLIVSSGENGRTNLLGNEGTYISKYFIAPYSNGNLTISNLVQTLQQLHGEMVVFPCRRIRP